MRQFSVEARVMHHSTGQAWVARSKGSSEGSAMSKFVDAHPHASVRFCKLAFFSFKVVRERKDPGISRPSWMNNGAS